MLSGQNPVDTDWSVFNYYRSKLHSQPNQFLLLDPLDDVHISSNGSARARPALCLLCCFSCKLANAQHRLQVSMDFAAHAKRWLWSMRFRCSV